MNEKELFDRINEELFKTGSCVSNSWHLIEIKSGDKVAKFEAMLPSRGNIRVRKPRGIQYEKEGEETVYYYDQWKFTNKKEFKYEGVFHSTRPKKYANEESLVNA